MGVLLSRPEPGPQSEPSASASIETHLRPWRGLGAFAVVGESFLGLLILGVKESLTFPAPAPGRDLLSPSAQ